jgi:hypothetical protein
MSRARHINEDAIRRIRRDQRRVFDAPERKADIRRSDGKPRDLVI